MNKILLSLCFIFIAIASAASVCACDINDYSLETNFCEDNVENIVLPENDAQITDDIGTDNDDSNYGAPLKGEHQEEIIIAPEDVSYTLSDVNNNKAIYPIKLMTKSGNIPLANKIITVEFDGVGGEFTTDESGMVNYVFYEPINGPGNYTIKIFRYDISGNPETTFTTNVEII